MRTPISIVQCGHPIRANVSSNDHTTWASDPGKGRSKSAGRLHLNWSWRPGRVDTCLQWAVPGPACGEPLMDGLLSSFLVETLDTLEAGRPHQAA